MPGPECDAGGVRCSLAGVGGVRGGQEGTGVA